MKLTLKVPTPEVAWSLDPSLLSGSLVGGGDAVEADAGLLLVVLAHVADLGVELGGHAQEGLLDLAADGFKSTFQAHTHKLWRFHGGEVGGGVTFGLVCF